MRPTAEAKSHIPGLRQNLRGVLAMTASMLALTLNFAFIKTISPVLPTGEILFLRGVLAGSAVAVIVFLTGYYRHLPRVAHKTVAWRTASESASAVLYFMALFQMPISNATVLYQTLPLALTTAAALFLGEQVRLKRWLAILLGFLGVIIVVRPGGSEYGVASLLMMMAVLCSVGRDLATKSMPAGIPTLLVAMIGMFALALVGLLSVSFETWLIPDIGTLLVIGIASALLVVGLSCLVAAMRAGELSVIAPFRYSSVVWAVALDYLIWERLIDVYMAVGAFMIVVSGIYVSYPLRSAAEILPRGSSPDNRVRGNVESADR